MDVFFDANIQLFPNTPGTTPMWPGVLLQSKSPFSIVLPHYFTGNRTRESDFPPFFSVHDTGPKRRSRSSTRVDLAMG
jgi:hypothetical protein